jgi:hypothetical protein
VGLKVFGQIAFE